MSPFRKYPPRYVYLFIVLPAILLAGSWWGYPKLFMNGPITSPHAAFGDDCTTCHEQSTGGLLKGIGSVRNQKCLKCHESEPHHWQINPAEQLAVLDQWPPETLKNMRVAILGDSYPAEHGYFPSSAPTEELVQQLTGRVMEVEVADPALHYDYHSEKPGTLLKESDLFLSAVPHIEYARLAADLQKLHGKRYKVETVAPDTLKKIEQDSDKRPRKFVLRIKHRNVDGDPRCTSCHLEHRGRERLMNASERPCLRCHENLEQHAPAGHQFQNVRPEGMHITSFVQGNHPDFVFDRYWLKGQSGTPRTKGSADSTVLQFNHKVHLTARASTEDSGKYRELWGLSCESCHEPDSAGEYMKPISYGAHCKKCHSLPVQHKLSREAARHLIMHKRSKDVVFGEADIEPDESDDGDDELDELDELEEEEEEEAMKEMTVTEAKAWVEKDLNRDEKAFFVKNGCSRCHQVASGKKLKSIVEPTRLPSRWFNHARFSHSSHNQVQCAECHTNAASSEQTPNLLLPNIGVCFRCHGPGRDQVAADCSVCHTFHDVRTKSGTSTTRKISDF